MPLVVVAVILSVTAGITILIMKGINSLRSVPDATVAKLLEGSVEYFSIHLSKKTHLMLPDGTILSGDFFLNALNLGGTWSGSGTGRIVSSNHGSIEVPASLATLSGSAAERLFNTPLGECAEEKSIFWGEEEKGISFSLESRSASLQIDLVPVEGGKWNIVALKSFSPGAPIGRGSAHISSIRFICSGGAQYAEAFGPAIAALLH